MKLTAESTVFNDDKVQEKFAELVVDADGIRTEVSKKVGNTEVISRINQSAESVKIQASKVEVDGTLIVGKSTVDAAEAEARKHADNYVTYVSVSDGIKVHSLNDTSNYIQINSSGSNIVKGGDSVAFYGESARVGKSSTGHIEIHGGAQGGGLQVYEASGSVLANIGYGNGNAESGTAIAPYFTFGTRKSGSETGNYSVAEGFNCVASKAYSHAEGFQTSALAVGAHAEGSNTEARSIDDHAEGADSVASGGWSHAEGYGTTASQAGSHAEGYSTTASGAYSHAGGMHTIASGTAQTVIGLYNQANTSSLFIIGSGSSSARKNVFEVSSNGYVAVNGTVVHSSDRRLKEHLSYVGDEAVEFINSLKPAHYIKDGEKHVGFYAQDVAEVDKWGCMVGEELNGYMTLGYTELIAPLVAYVQRLEKRIEELERSK